MSKHKSGQQQHHGGGVKGVCGCVCAIMYVTSDQYYTRSFPCVYAALVLQRSSYCSFAFAVVSRVEGLFWDIKSVPPDITARICIRCTRALCYVSPQCSFADMLGSWIAITSFFFFSLLSRSPRHRTKNHIPEPRFTYAT